MDARDPAAETLPERMFREINQVHAVLLGANLPQHVHDPLLSRSWALRNFAFRFMETSGMDMGEELIDVRDDAGLYGCALCAESREPFVFRYFPLHLPPPSVEGMGGLLDTGVRRANPPRSAREACCVHTVSVLHKQTNKKHKKNIFCCPAETRVQLR